MSLKIPPPLIALLSGGCMWLFSRVFPDLNLSLNYSNHIALTTAAIGLMIEIVSVRLFLRSKTTINPLAPERSSTLVIRGLYKFSRNPMYLGMLLLLTGYGLWLGNPPALVMLLFFVWYITSFQIKPEEIALLEQFGDNYRAYQQRVRRWI